MLLKKHCPSPINSSATSPVGTLRGAVFFAMTPDPNSRNRTKAFANEYSLTPGTLSQKWLKNVGFPASRETAAMFLERCARQDNNAGGANLPFRPTALNSQFYTTEAFDHFRSGVFLETAAVTSAVSLRQGFTPYHILLTLGGIDQPLLPPKGLSANQLRRYIENFGWLLHISVHDSGLLTTRGDARSSFTEHSPLAWILCQVLAFLKQSAFCQAWSKLDHQQVRYSYGFLRSVSELWDAIVVWASPRLPRLHYFLASPSSLMPAKQIVLLYSELPEQTGTNDKFLRDYLAQWMVRFRTRFDPDHLGSHVGATFLRKDPPDYLWQSLPSNPHQPPAPRPPVNEVPTANQHRVAQYSRRTSMVRHTWRSSMAHRPGVRVLHPATVPCPQFPPSSDPLPVSIIVHLFLLSKTSKPNHGPPSRKSSVQQGARPQYSSRQTRLFHCSIAFLTSSRAAQAASGASDSMLTPPLRDCRRGR
jgi:hypothetical protein